MAGSVRTAHDLIAFASGRSAIPRRAIQRSDVLQRIVGSSSAYVLIPRGALLYWSVHVRHRNHFNGINDSLDDLCMVVKVADFLADPGAVDSAGALVAEFLLQDPTVSPEQVGEVLDTLTENQALAVLRARAVMPSHFRAHYLKQPRVLMQHLHRGQSFRPLHQLLTALPPSHERLALLSHTAGIEGSASLCISITETAATLQAVRVAAKHFRGLTSLSFRPWMQQGALSQALLCACSLPQLVSLDISGMHVSQQISSSIAGALHYLPRLQEINLSSCGLRAGAAEILFQALQGSLSAIALRNNNLNEGSSRVLAAQFVRLKVLQRLDISFTSLRAAAVQHVVGCLHHLAMLRTLDICGNPLHSTPDVAAQGAQHVGGGSTKSHPLPLHIARSLEAKLAALPHFEQLLCDQHCRITHAGHMHAALDAPPSPDPSQEPSGGPTTTAGVGLLTALFNMQRYMHSACIHVDLEPTTLPLADHSMHAVHSIDTMSHLTELRMHLNEISGHGAALAESLTSLGNLRRLKVTMSPAIAGNELCSFVNILSTLQRLVQLEWHHPGPGTAPYANSLAESLCSLSALVTLELDCPLQDPLRAGVVGDAFRGLRSLTSLHVACCTDSLMACLSPLLPATLQHMGINAICEHNGLAAFCMHAPCLPVLDSLSLAAQHCNNADMHALADYLPQLSSLTMLYVTLVKSSFAVEHTSTEPHCTDGSTTAVCQHLQHEYMACGADANDENSKDASNRGGAGEQVDGACDNPVHAGHACVWSEWKAPEVEEGRCYNAPRVLALEALASSIARLPRLQSLRLGLDVWTEAMMDSFFPQSAMHVTSRLRCMESERPSKERQPSAEVSCATHTSMPVQAGASDKPHLAALTGCNFFLPLGPAHRLPQHVTDKLLPPAGLFPHALSACSHLESLEAEHCILSHAAVCPLYTLTVLPHLLVLDLQAIHLSVTVARKLARALHGIELPCLTFLRLDIISAAVQESPGITETQAAGISGLSCVWHANFGLVGDADPEFLAPEDLSDAAEHHPDTHATAPDSPQDCAEDMAPRVEHCDEELAAVLSLLPQLPSLVTLMLSSHRSNMVGWKAAALAWCSGGSVQHMQRVKKSEQFAQSLSRVLSITTRLQHLQLSTSRLPDSAVQAVGCLAELPSLTELCLGESSCGSNTADALLQQLSGHTALSIVKLTGLRLRDTGARAVSDWLYNLPALRDVTFDNLGLNADGCVYVDKAITDMKHSVRFTQKGITYVWCDWM